MTFDFIMPEVVPDVAQTECARMTRGLYLALVAEGFSTEEAISLLAAIASGQ